MLWGEKPSIINEKATEVPIYTYREILDLGYESREALRSEDASESLLIAIISSQLIVRHNASTDFRLSTFVSLGP